MYTFCEGKSILKHCRKQSIILFMQFRLSNLVCDVYREMQTFKVKLIYAMSSLMQKCFCFLAIGISNLCRAWSTVCLSTNWFRTVVLLVNVTVKFNRVNNLIMQYNSKFEVCFLYFMCIIIYDTSQHEIQLFINRSVVEKVYFGSVM